MNAIHLSNATFAGRDRTARPSRVRIVHLGLGNFHRAHQAWYTAHAGDATEWGIAAFTGRSPQQADLLRDQDGLYALVVRSASADQVEIVPNLIEVHPAARLDRLVELLRGPDVVIVTLTITEVGYRLTADGVPDTSDSAVASDIVRLRTAFATRSALDGVAVETTLARLLLGLEARRRADVGAIAIVPCDNIPFNGEYVRSGLIALASLISPPLASWLEKNATFVSSSVDRITPRIDAEVAAVENAGWIDASPVVTEPFSDWVLAGAFPGGRPQWETAGARFVDDLEPWENRKLWLLNGAHSILAFAGLARGLDTVAAAIEDPVCIDLVTEFWAEAVTLLPAGIEHEQYRLDLLERFRNPRIVHRLAQIAGDATTKVRWRFIAVAERVMAAGRVPDASAAAVSTWISALLDGVVPADAFAVDIAGALVADDRIASLLALVSRSLSADEGFRGLVAAHLRLRTTGGASHVLEGREQ